MNDMNVVEMNKQAAVNFLELVIAHKIDEAYEKYEDLNGRHHNVNYAAGFGVLKQGMIDNDLQVLDRKIEIVNVLGDGDLVAVHSHLTLGTSEITVVHIFRFKDQKIVEFWDLGNEIPKDSPNRDGAF